MSDDIFVVVGVGGMGEAIARRAGSGTRLLLADFNADLLQSVAERLDRDGFAVTTHQVDVSSRTSVAELADTAAQLGPVRRLAHTAGLSPEQAEATAILRVDLAGVAYSLDEFARVISPGGAAVVIASMAGTMAAPRLPADLLSTLTDTPSDDLLALPFLAPPALPDPRAAYGIAKRANQLRVQAASITWGRRGARVNSISPGVIATPMGRQELDGDSGAQIRTMIAASGTGRIGTTSDIAAAAAFLLGPDATFITGTDLLVDGGAVAGVVARQTRTDEG